MFFVIKATVFRCLFVLPNLRLNTPFVFSIYATGALGRRFHTTSTATVRISHSASFWCTFLHSAAIQKMAYFWIRTFPTTTNRGVLVSKSLHILDHFLPLIRIMFRLTHRKSLFIKYNAKYKGTFRILREHWQTLNKNTKCTHILN